MKTSIAGSIKTDRTTQARGSAMQKLLLACGVLYFPLYFISHILAGMQLQGYSHIHQMVSELSAIGSPARPLLDAFGIVGNILLIGFGLGVWKAAGVKRSLRATGVMLMILGVLAFTWWLAPMSPRESEKGANDIAHLIIAYSEVLLLMLIIGFGSGADGKWFRIYSILTILAACLGCLGSDTDSPDRSGIANPVGRCHRAHQCLWTVGMDDGSCPYPSQNTEGAGG